MDNILHIFKSNGFYLGFIKNNQLFSRDGLYLAWVEGDYVWDVSGRFRGVVVTMGTNRYVLFNRFTMPPVTRSPRPTPSPVVPPPAPSNIAPINLPIEFTDAF